MAIRVGDRDGDVAFCIELWSSTFSFIEAVVLRGDRWAIFSGVLFAAPLLGDDMRAAARGGRFFGGESVIVGFKIDFTWRGGYMLVNLPQVYDVVMQHSYGLVATTFFQRIKPSRTNTLAPGLLRPFFRLRSQARERRRVHCRIFLVSNEVCLG